MSSEIAQVVAFLRETPPFGALEERAIAALSRTITVRYARAGDRILQAGQHNDWLFVVRSGAVELRLAGEELTARLTQGASFAYPSLLRGGEVRNETIALEDTLLYLVPAAEFHRLRETSPPFRAFFSDDEQRRLRHALEQRAQGRAGGFDGASVGDVAHLGAPVSCLPETSIGDAARLMRQHKVSTLTICADGKLLGIFTDKDLRNRVVAADVPGTEPVGAVMTGNPRTLPASASLAEAVALMASGGFRHIPLVDEAGRLSGMLSATDILAHLGNNAIDIGLSIARAQDAEALAAAARRIPESFAAMARSGTQPAQLARFTSALGEAAHRRAAQLAERELGPPPVPYALVVFGSLAREEQLIGSDQDNGLLIDDALEPEEGAYFEALGGRISDILDACGFVYCKGGIMAKNADQRLTLAQWRARYARWIDNPDEDAILRATIFFDMRCVHGEAALVHRLHEETVSAAAANRIFVSYIARDALRSKVPLGIFRNLVLDRSESGEKVFDAKAQAVVPVVDIARTLALGHGIAAVGTVARLRALSELGHMAGEDSESLIDALAFVNELRIVHQAGLAGAGQRADNAIAPDSLSPLEREHLKDCFSVIRRGLDSLRRNLAGGIA
ncbi:MAG: CBS domain-containing protein [Sphingomonadaceae bacterium]|nr:CBS domain-containing protein [Sphingomonadaceae bacterium]